MGRRHTKVPATSGCCGGRRSPATPRSPPLLAEPDRIELLIQEVARAHRPTPHLRQMRHDPVPLEAHDEMHFPLVEPLLALAHESHPPLGIETARLPGGTVVQYEV